jgi:tetratricopeptide (TPR) repeat protein
MCLHLQVVISTCLNTLVNVRGIILKGLAMQDAMRLLKGCDFPDLQLRALADRLGFLTIALAVSTRILKKGILPEELIKGFDKKGALVFSRELSDPAFGYCPDLVQLFDMSLKMVNRDADLESTLAEHMLSVGGWFANASVRLQVLGAGALQLGTGLESTELADAFSRLEQYSLGIRNLDGSVSFHQLVQTYGKYRGGQAAGKAMIEALKVKGQLVSDHPHFDHACRQVLPLLEHKLNLNTEELNPFVKEILLQVVKEGHYFRAKELISGLTLGNLNEQLRLICQDKQGTILAQCGDYIDAEALHREVLKVKEKTRGSDHLETLHSVNNLANDVEVQGRHSEAEELHWRALEGREARLGQDHPDTLDSVNNLAIALYEQGRHREAEDLLRRALEGREARLGLEHPDTLDSLNNLAGTLYVQGEHNEAEELHRRALKGRKARLGLDHPRTLDSVNKLALALHEQGRHSEAETLHRRALEGREERQGLNHPATLGSVDNLANALDAQGRHSEAEELYQRALKGREARLGLDHPDTLDSVHNLAVTLSVQGRHSEVEELHRRALKGREAALGIEHPDTLRSCYYMGVVVSKEGRHSAAVLYFQRALSGQEKVLGPNHAITRNTEEALASAEWAQWQHVAARRRWILCCCGAGALLLFWQLRTSRSP